MSASLMPSRISSLSVRPATRSMYMAFCRASTYNSDGVGTPSLRALIKALVSPTSRARVIFASSVGWRYVFLNLCLTIAGFVRNVTANTRPSAPCAMMSDPSGKRAPCMASTSFASSSSESLLKLTWFFSAVRSSSCCAGE